ncbi:MAG: glycosyltransferase [Oscillospiraceae bacterium]|nr:glycosyltransferase [Oscillospiraceae bacterium]
MACCVVIPAYEPEQSFVDYVRTLLAQEGVQVVVVDDGSGPGWEEIFSALEGLGCTVLRHPVNRGKGAALKTAFRWYLAQSLNCPGIVTADCDGQHRMKDVLRLQAALEENDHTLLLGSRSFGPGTPARSRSGNRFSAAALSLLYGIQLQDTQTGLRGIPNSLIPSLCQLQGARFEYELNMLISARQQQYELRELPIETLYFDNNRGSHFRTLSDTLRIAAVLGRSILQYAGAAALSVVIDVGVYALLVKAVLAGLSLPQRLFYATVTARILSSAVNYTCNRRLPYVQNRRLLPTLGKYYLLWLCQLTASFAGAWLLTGRLGMDDLAGKLLVDLLLALLSYQIQLRWVFREKEGGTVWTGSSALSD